MLAINNLTFRHGDRALYEDASLHIKERDKVGLIGANGTGKSTLLRLIAGEYTADEGEINMSKDCTIGFLNQDLLSIESDQPIRDVAMEAFERELKLERDINKILVKLETDTSEKVLDQLAKKQELFETLGGYSIQAKSEEILEGLGFVTEDLVRPLNTFSGGWRMRVMLAKILLSKPSLLLLDEPTNHLDLPSIEWLENYIKNYEGAIIIVSHDQRFLNECCSMTAEVENSEIAVYPGNYDFFIKEKQLRKEIQQSAFKNQQKKIKDTEAFINRFKAQANKAKQVQSRVKALEKMSKVDEPTENNSSISFNFNFSKEPGKVVMDLKNVSKAYGDNVILDKANATILRQDKIALIGANGKGKSTLMRIIKGTEDFEGERNMGYHVIDSFFAQHQLESLNLNNNLLQELEDTGIEKTEQELRSVLGCFLFGEDEVEKKIQVLSGGEKSRVALAKTLISEANFLLLDEPTNHLDIQSLNMLIQALQQYKGTFVIISHDRHFISEVATKIWYIEDQQIKEYPGNYKEFTFWWNNIKEQKKETKPNNPAPKTKVKKPAPTSQQRENDKAIQSIKKEAQKLEQKLESTKKDKSRLEQKLSDPNVYGDPEKLASLTLEFNEIEKTYEQLNDEWLQLAEKLEDVELK